jgi:hypothetical protein
VECAHWDEIWKNIVPHNNEVRTLESHRSINLINYHILFQTYLLNCISFQLGTELSLNKVHELLLEVMSVRQKC